MKRILIVDDSLFSRRIIATPLRKNGYDVMEAVNGNDALEKISSYQPDLILLDILMPEKDGIAVLRDLRNEKTSIPVIMLTSDVQDTTRETCLELGAAAFLNKPVQAEELLMVIQSLKGN